MSRTPPNLIQHKKNRETATDTQGKRKSRCQAQDDLDVGNTKDFKVAIIPKFHEGKQP